MKAHCSGAAEHVGVRSAKPGQTEPAGTWKDRERGCGFAEPSSTIDGIPGSNSKADIAITRSRADGPP